MRTVWIAFLIAWLGAGGAFPAQVDLNWTDNADNESGFRIEREVAGAGFTQIGAVGADVTTFTDSDVVPGTTYAYRVYAHNAAGNSPYSNIATATVPGANTPPSIAAIADQILLVDATSAPIPFTVGDAETAPGALTVTATSANTALIPNFRLTLAGTGASRTLTLRPRAAQYGTAVITVTVSDGTATASTQFTLTVGLPPPAVTDFTIADR